MDLPALLAARARAGADRRARAHQRARASSTRKRYEDIDDVLDAGIDVFSTVNVQHLESLNDQVAELTGVRVRETVPDARPRRGRRGRAHRPHARGAARSACARARSTRPSACRPRSTASSRSRTSRRCARSRCARSPRRSRPSGWSHDESSARARSACRTAAPQAVAERLLALVKPQPRVQRLVRRAWRSAQRLGAELDLALGRAARARADRASEREQLDALRRLASVLGAHLLVEEGDDVAEVVRASRASAARPTCSWARPRRRAGSRRLAEPLPCGSIEALPGVDVRIVADRSRARASRAP